MSLLSDAELTAMRASVGLLLPDVCDILSATSTPDGQGGVTQTWGTATADQPCRLDVSVSRETTETGAVQLFTTYKLSMPYDTDITAANRVQVDNVVYAVTGINSAQSWHVVKRLDLELV